MSLATNGIAAVRAAADTHFDIILMDWHMPEMDGLEAARAIRDNETAAGSGARVPIVAVTANALHNHRERCIEAGMDDYLSKPFTRAQLRTILEQWLNQAEAEKALCIVRREERSRRSGLRVA